MTIIPLICALVYGLAGQARHASCYIALRESRACPARCSLMTKEKIASLVCFPCKFLTSRPFMSFCAEVVICYIGCSKTKWKARDPVSTPAQGTKFFA